MIGRLIGGPEGLGPVEKNLVDRATLSLYVAYRDTGAGSWQPTLQDLCRTLDGTDAPTGHELAVAHPDAREVCETLAP